MVVEKEGASRRTNAADAESDAPCTPLTVTCVRMVYLSHRLQMLHVHLTCLSNTARDRLLEELVLTTWALPLYACQVTVKRCVT